MALSGKKYFVLSNNKFSERPRRSWRESLRRWLVQCPNCSEIRLAVGARENDKYICKDCGHSFVINRTVAVKENSSSI
jgi:rRNA maturation endonuclease Nob1